MRQRNMAYFSFLSMKTFKENMIKENMFSLTVPFLFPIVYTSSSGLFQISRDWSGIIVLVLLSGIHNKKSTQTDSPEEKISLLSLSTTSPGTCGYGCLHVSSRRPGCFHPSVSFWLSFTATAPLGGSRHIVSPSSRCSPPAAICLPLSQYY